MDPVIQDKLIRAFLMGMIESHSDVTLHHDDADEADAYDVGRNIARTVQNLDD